jgi:hypothetical protein
VVNAHWDLNPVAAQKADEAVWKEIPKYAGIKLNLLPELGHYRKLWMDYYIRFGGPATEIEGTKVRIAPIVMNDPIAARVDDAFLEKHPDLKGRRLTFRREDAPLRKEWMDLFVYFGGEVVFIGNTQIRIPRALVEQPAHTSPAGTEFKGKGVTIRVNTDVELR